MGWGAGLPPGRRGSFQREGRGSSNDWQTRTPAPGPLGQARLFTTIFPLSFSSAQLRIRQEDVSARKSSTSSDVIPSGIRGCAR